MRGPLLDKLLEFALDFGVLDADGSLLAEDDQGLVEFQLAVEEEFDLDEVSAPGLWIFDCGSLRDVAEFVEAHLPRRQQDRQP